jgi:hypothetical protein
MSAMSGKQTLRLARGSAFLSHCFQLLDVRFALFSHLKQHSDRLWIVNKPCEATALGHARLHILYKLIVGHARLNQSSKLPFLGYVDSFEMLLFGNGAVGTLTRTNYAD